MVTNFIDSRLIVDFNFEKQKPVNPHYNRFLRLETAYSNCWHEFVSLIAKESTAHEDYKSKLGVKT